MPVVKILTLSGEELIPNASLEPDERLQQLAAQAAEALRVQLCKLTRDGQVLSMSATAAESSLEDGDSLVAVALGVSEVMIQICSSLIEYFELLCQNLAGDLKMLEGRLSGRDPNENPCIDNLDTATSRKREELQSTLRKLRELQQLPAQVVEGYEAGREFATLIEAGLQQSAQDSSTNQCEGRLPLPPGICEFFDVAAQAGLLRSWPLGDLHLLGAETHPGDLHIETGEASALVLAPFFREGETGGVLVKFAEISYNDYADAQCLCMEWRPGRQPRYVAFKRQCCMMSDVAFHYNWSDPAPSADGEDEGLMANEEDLSQLGAWRTAVYASFSEVLQGLVEELRKRREDSSFLGPGVFTVPMDNRWQCWGRTSSCD